MCGAALVSSRAGAAEEKRPLDLLPSETGLFLIPDEYKEKTMYADKSRGAKVKGVGRPERLEASAVVCGEAVSLLREHVASKRIVVLRYRADTTGLHLFVKRDHKEMC